MTIDGFIENEINDIESICEFVRTIAAREKEMVLTSEGQMVGAILTAQQYEWFLNQIDEQQDLGLILERVSDKSGSQHLDDFKRELGKEL